MLTKVKFARTLSVGFALATALFITSCSETVNPELKTPVVQEEGVFPNGVNFQPSYYNGGNCDLGWALLRANTKIKTVRIEVEPNQVTNAKRWISEAKANGMTVIVSYHKSAALGSNSTAELNAAANWWRTNYAALGGGFTVNLMNEWGDHNITSNAYASAYNTAIATVRSVYGGRIIIDIPGWGQETRTAAEAVKGTNGTKINDTNIILSTHIYPGAYNQGRGRYVTNADLDELGGAGRSCIVGEFGSIGGSGANWSGLVDYAKAKGWTVLGWAWGGDGIGMNMISPQYQAYTAGRPKTYTKSSYFNTVYNKL